MIIDAFLLGIATGTSCLTTCAPVVLPYLLSEKMEGVKGTSQSVLLFLLGRLIGYVSVGFLLGALGAYASSYLNPVLARTLTRIMFSLVGILMLFLGIMHTFPKGKTCGVVKNIHRTKRSAFTIGILMGLSLCPPFFTAAVQVFGKQSSLGGALYFFIFYLGTSLYFLPLFGIGFFQNKMEKIRMVARTSLILFGMYYLGFIGILGVLS